MGRPRKININRYALLASVVTMYDRWLAEIDGEMADALAKHTSRDPDGDFAWGRYCELKRERDRLVAYGLPYSLEMFMGRDLTPSERIRAGEALRALHAEKLVRLDGLRATHAMPLDAGREYVAKMAASRTEATSDA